MIAQGPKGPELVTNGLTARGYDPATGKELWGHHNARLFVYDAATGEVVYRARFSKGGTFTGSPIYAAGKLYFTTEEGQVYVVQAGREHEELAVKDMGEVVMTTLAISEGTLFIRTRTHLVAIGDEAGAEEMAGKR